MGGPHDHDHGHDHDHEPARAAAGEDCCDETAAAASAGAGRGKKAMHFLTTIPKEEAAARWAAALAPLSPLGDETVALADAWRRVLAEDVVAPIDLPPFDRSLVDGFAVVAADTFAAGEEAPVRLRRLADAIPAGRDPTGIEVGSGACCEIATGAPIPRGANAVVMVEHTELEGEAAATSVAVFRAAVPGGRIQTAGADVRRGEIVFRRGARLGARETGTLAALGIARVAVRRRPRVAIVSTGDELREPGEPLAPGTIYDSNARILADLCRENGAEPVAFPIARDDEEQIRATLEDARRHDMVVLSGGTSKGAGDLSYRLVSDFEPPGKVVHGVAVKPGKPIVLAAWGRKPVMILPGFPTSAVITFGIFGLPVLRRLAGLEPVEAAARVEAEIALPMPSEPGRHEYVLVDLAPGTGDADPPRAFPLLKGSGSVSAFARADGYLEVAAGRKHVERGTRFPVTLLRGDRAIPPLVFVGSPCPALDEVFALLEARHGVTAKIVPAGSGGVLEALATGAADVAGVHGADEDGGPADATFAERAPGAVVIRGYVRRQGILAARATLEEALGRARAAAGVDADAEAIGVACVEALIASGARLLNRNRGSGARELLEGIIATLAARGENTAAGLGKTIAGYGVETRSHAGVAAAIAAGRADWGLAIESVAGELGFQPLREEGYDLVVAAGRSDRPAVAALLDVLGSEEARAAIEARRGYRVPAGIGKPRA